jgi:hypothetical protein
MDAASLVLRRPRVPALAALLLVLLAYGAFAGHLFELPSGLDVAFLCAVVLPAFAAVVWLALPLAGRGHRLLLGAGAAAAALAAGCTLLDLDSGANVAKLACYTLLGYWFLSLFEEAWWITLVASVVPWVDIWSVAAGPTRYVLEEKPGIFDRVSVAFPNPGAGTSVNVGPPDFVFFALFLAAAGRFRLRVGWTWLSITGLLGLTLVAVWAIDDLAGLPALPAVCLGFLLPNADLLLRDARAAWRGRRDAPSAE